MVKAFLTGPLLGLLIVFGFMSSAIASGRSSGRLNPCNIRIITDDSNPRIVGSSSVPRITRIEQTCVVNIRRIRAETQACGLNQYSQPNVGEFRRSEWRRNGRVVYSETELVRCF